MKNWWASVKDKPVTWGSYWKLCKWSMLVSVIVLVPYYLWLFKDEITLPKISWPWKKQYVNPDMDVDDLPDEEDIFI